MLATPLMMRTSHGKAWALLCAGGTPNAPLLALDGHVRSQTVRRAQASIFRSRQLQREFKAKTLHLRGAGAQDFGIESPGVNVQTGKARWVF
jgi:hypothetical protein